MTGLISARLLESDVNTVQRYGYMQFMADCVIKLDHRIEGGVSARALRVVKYRGSDYAANEAPVTISGHGFEVASYGMPTVGHVASEERVSTGIDELDRALHGGLFRGSSVLITGAPGTAKTTLAGAFTEAACRRGERVILFPFDEAAEEVVRNLRSVGIDLQPHVDAGRLRIVSRRAEAAKRRQELAESAAEARAQMERLQHQVEAIEQQMALLERQQEAQEKHWEMMRLGTGRARGEEGPEALGEERAVGGGEG